MFGFNRRDCDPATQHDLRELKQMINDLRGTQLAFMTHVLQKERQMANDLTALKTAVTDLETAVGNLPPPQPDQQVDIDDLTTRVTAVKDKLTPTP